MATKIKYNKTYDVINFEKLEILKKVDAQPHVTCIKVEEQLSIPVSMLNNIMVNKNFSNVYIHSQTEKNITNF
jgi:hypothetical protein